MKNYLGMLITKKWFKIVSVAALLMIIVFIVSRLGVDEKPFNPVTLSQNNLILSQYKRCDTILSVGLDVVGINGITVNIMPLSDKTKSSFGGDLKAHIRYHEDVYYLFIDHNVSTSEMIRIISHEIVHIQQYQSRRLIYDSGILLWEGNQYDLNLINYDSRPWENEAFIEETPIYNKVFEILYK